MSYTGKDLKKIMESVLKPDDTFTFECAMCGNCCRNRREPILLTGADIFRAAKALGKPIQEVMEQNTHGYIGDDSHIPCVVLKERLDGSCRFLRNGKCTIQNDKPVVCALYPLGRLFDPQTGEYHYFLNQQTCQSGQKSGRVWTLQEWLDLFKIEETAQMTAVWYRLLTGLAQETHKMDKGNISGQLLSLLLYVLYLNYDVDKSYIEQVERNMDIAKAEFKRMFHKELRFDA